MAAAKKNTKLNTYERGGGREREGERGRERERERVVTTAITFTTVANL
jgi:hypothetical protein